MSIKDKILSAKLTQEAIEVPEWGTRVVVREMDGVARDRFEVANRELGDKARLVNMRARLLVACLYDEAGEKIFGDDEAEQLGHTPAGPLVMLADVAARVNRMDEEAELKN